MDQWRKQPRERITGLLAISLPPNSQVPGSQEIMQAVTITNDDLCAHGHGHMHTGVYHTLYHLSHTQWKTACWGGWKD